MGDNLDKTNFSCQDIAILYKYIKFKHFQLNKIIVKGYFLNKTHKMGDLCLYLINDNLHQNPIWQRKNIQN